MRYLLIGAFVVFFFTKIYILYTNKNAAFKRKAFRWWLAALATFLAVYSAVTIQDKVLLLVVLPVLAGVIFGLLKFTKFCNWCGRMVQTNLPIGNNTCPRCGSAIS